MQITLENYSEFLGRIQQKIGQTRRNIVKLVNRQKVEMSWEVGKEIEEHLAGRPKADYGEEFFKKLSQDTLIEKSTLYQMRAFYKAYPQLPVSADSHNILSWSHYRNLIAIKDDRTRQEIENLTIQMGLGTNKLQQEIKKLKIGQGVFAENNLNKTSPLKVSRGRIFNYKMSSSDEIDLGFNIFKEFKKGSLKSEIVEDAIVEVIKKEEEYSLKDSNLKSTQLHTYKAQLERVVDGDTIRVKLDLGFQIKHREILRLAKINAPESKTASGKKSTQFLKNILEKAPFLIIKTNKTDIYGRYIADVFIGKENQNDPQKVADEGIYLSQLLLDKGLAERY